MARPARVMGSTLSPPSTAFAVAELPRALFELASLLPTHWLLSRAPRGDGHPVITLPGFRSNDSSMNILRRYLERWGYEGVPWGLGTNLGVGFERTAYERRFVRKLEAVVAAAGRPASLVGWSQGGVIARQAAKQRPDLVRQVVTLGSPIGSTPEATTLWRIFERTSRLEITDELMDTLREVSSPLPGVRCTCIYSKTDGIVAPQIAQDRTSSLTENIAVFASHFGMAVNPLVLYVIADRLSQPEGDWRPFSVSVFDRWFRRRAR